MLQVPSAILHRASEPLSGGQIVFCYELLQAFRFWCCSEIKRSGLYVRSASGTDTPFCFPWREHIDKRKALLCPQLDVSIFLYPLFPLLSLECWLFKYFLFAALIKKSTGCLKQRNMKISMKLLQKVTIN